MYKKNPEINEPEYLSLEERIEIVERVESFISVVMSMGRDLLPKIKLVKTDLKTRLSSDQLKAIETINNITNSIH